MTTVSVLPTAWVSLEAALRARRPVWVTYHRRRRLICPHALGWRAGKAMVLGYQTGGETSSGALDPDHCKRWRVLFVDEIDDPATTEAANGWGTADNYDVSHPFPVIDEVFTAVDLAPASRHC